MAKSEKNRILGKLVFLLLLIALLIACVKIFPFILSKQSEQLTSLQNDISRMKDEIIPIRFKILGKKDNTYVIQIRFYDLNDKETANCKLSITGQELNFDFSVIKPSIFSTQDKTYLYFPIKIFTDSMAPENGIDLVNLYSKNGFPSVYNGLELTDESKKSLSGLFYLVSKNEKVSDFSYGNSVHDIRSVSNFKTGFVYDIVCHTHSGGIEIVKE